MPIDYSMDPERGVLRTRAAGEMTDVLLEDYMTRLIDDGSWPDGSDALVDARGIEGLAVTADGIARISEISRRGEERFRDSRWAIVTDRDAVLGMASMYTLRRDPASFEIEIFREAGEACEWLGISLPEDLAK